MYVHHQLLLFRQFWLHTQVQLHKNTWEVSVKLSQTQEEKRTTSAHNNRKQVQYNSNGVSWADGSKAHGTRTRNSDARVPRVGRPHVGVLGRGEEVHAELAVEAAHQAHEGRAPELLPAAQQLLHVRQVHHLPLLHQRLHQVPLEAPARRLHVVVAVPVPHPHHRFLLVTCRRRCEHPRGGHRRTAPVVLRGRRRRQCARPAAAHGAVGGVRVRRRAGVGLGAHGHQRPEHRADGAEASGPVAPPPAGAARLHLAQRAAELLRGAPALEEPPRQALARLAVAWLALYAAQRHGNRSMMDGSALAACAIMVSAGV
jgi:hypothetical protein